MSNLTGYVDVFYGCGEITPRPEGIAKKWYFLKAGAGNTTPAATLPFGAVSVAPYSGGYPTGYGNHLVNTFARPSKFEEGSGLIGFSHLHQSGTGAIGYYYNYAVVTPRYDSSPFRRLPQNESGSPGYYSCRLEDIECELTVSQFVAFHRYSFGSNGGFVTVDFLNNGLNIPGFESKKATDLRINQVSSDTVTACAVIEGICIFFALKCTGKAEASDTGVKITGFGRECLIMLSISLKSAEKALSYINSEETSFDFVRKKASEKWERAFSHFIIETGDETVKRKFYSNLYHSLVKPCDWSGDGFIDFDGTDSFVTDFATLWDIYKNQLPLLFLSYGDISRKICDTLFGLCEKLGEIPNAFGLSDRYNLHSSQARCLGDYALMSAYHSGILTDGEKVINCVYKDITAPSKSEYIKTGKCVCNTWTLDMQDCCMNAAIIARKTGNKYLEEKFISLYDNTADIYDEKGLLTADSEYYEGTRFNYSFRPMVDMKKKISRCGGEENFVRLLDDFFGYGKEDVVLPTDPKDSKTVYDNYNLGRFEGFNNESDTEAPLSYIYAGRHDRTCEIIRAGMSSMFTTGRGAIPGNNDSGALSSYYVLAAVGFFPVAGQDLCLLGSPFIDKAEITLSNGKRLSVFVSGNSEKNVYVKSVLFNAKPVENFTLRLSDLMKGGELIFEMTDSIPAS